METSTLEVIKSWTTIFSSLASIIAICAAAWWFLVTTKFKPRIQFDLDCNFFRLEQNDKDLIAELQFIFENKGFVEHRLYNLNISVHTLESENELSSKEKTKELIFSKRILPQVCIVPKKYKYFFIRPGSRQVITHSISIPKNLSVIRVTAGFDYERSGDYPHTARKIFKVQ